MQSYLSIKKESAAFAVLLAFGSLSPLLIHSAGLYGTVWLPIFFIISIGAPFLRLSTLILLSLCNPILNNLLTGMPPYAPIPMLPLLVMNGILLSLLAAPFRRKPLILALALFVGLTLLQALAAFITTRYGGTSNFWLVLPRGVVLNAGLGFISGLFAHRR